MGAKARWAIAIGAVLALGLAVWWASNQQTIKAKRGYAVSQLRDPDSVQFRNERLTDAGWLCGELNGKNAYGAYAGFKRFVSLGEYDAWIEGSGYAGQKRHAIGQSELDRESLRAQLDSLKIYKQLRDDGIVGPEAFSEDQIAERGEKYLFAEKWRKNCT